MIEPLDDELADYVGAFQQLDRPTPTARAATWAAIHDRIAAEDAPPRTRLRPGARADEPAPRRLARPALAALAAALALGLGLASVATWHARRATDVAASDLADDRSPQRVAPAPGGTVERAPDSHESPPASDASDESPADPRPDESAPPGPHALAPAGDAPPTDREPPRTTAKPPRPRPASAPSLRPEEVASFRRAQAALADGHADAALQALDEHGRRFPGGMFEEERRISRATALCRLGRVADARAVRDRFLREYPTSHLVDRARTICREIE